MTWATPYSTYVFFLGKNHGGERGPLPRMQGGAGRAPRPAPLPPPLSALEREVCWKPQPVSVQPSRAETPRGAPFDRPVPPGQHPEPAPLPPPEWPLRPSPPIPLELSLGWPQPAPTTGSLQIVSPCSHRIKNLATCGMPQAGSNGTNDSSYFITRPSLLYPLL